MTSIQSGPGLSERDKLAERLAPLLDQGAVDYPDSPAYSIVLPNGTTATVTFAQAKRLSDAVAFYLRRVAGFNSGDVAAVMAPNCLAFPIVAKGIFKSGLIFTGINPLYTPREANHQLKDSGARCLFIIDLFAGSLGEILAGTRVEKIIRLSLADLMPPAQAALVRAALRVKGMTPTITASGVEPLRAVLKAGDRAALSGGETVADLYSTRRLDDPLLYQYTSGTTGRSKGATITESNVLTNIFQTHAHNDQLYEAGRETGLVVMPLYHVMALSFTLMQAPRNAIHCVLVPQPRPIANLRPAFRKFDVTILPGINTLYQALMGESWFREAPPSRLKLCLSGAAPLQRATREAWESLTGCPIYEGYGLTEGTCVVTFPKLHERQVHGTVGHPLPGTEVRLVDENGHPVPAGERGEVIVRGPQVVPGYLNNQEATAATIRDGWLYTGDIGVFDPDGALRIVDRKKDMIIVSGFNVYPAEIEDVLTSMPGVAEAAVVGVPSEDTGEAVVAFIVAAPNADLDDAAIQAHCARHLTNYKRPRRITFIDALPKSPVGKILRRTLREHAVAAKDTPSFA